MKEIYVILAFHAHELLWDLPDTLLSYLAQDNPMKDSLLTTNYLKERREEGRDIYGLCSEFGDKLDAPLCVEYTNELLVQVKKVMPGVFARLKKDYQRGRLYPLYGHAHHAHVSLLQEDEITQEILWNKDYLHNQMDVPFPGYCGLFPPEASLNYKKFTGIIKANIDYVIFPHLDREKVPFTIKGEGDYKYRPFLIKKAGKNTLAFPRNFPISQEIWRPITKMKRDALKAQGYILGDYPVFNNEYYGDKEKFPISFEEAVEIYAEVLKNELKKAPDMGLLLYIQDLELMDFGDIALDIMGKAWKSILTDEQDYQVRFVTPDQYIDEVLAKSDINQLPEVRFEKICWAPEIRLILRADGHYPPLGVDNVRGYTKEKTGLYDNPHVFWENGKYYTGIFDILLENFNITTEVAVDPGKLGENDYDLARESLNSQAVLYLRIMKRACNWGWRPTEGRQKRPCLLGYLLSSVLLKKLKEYPGSLIINQDYTALPSRNIVGLAEMLEVFIDSRLNYLKYGLDEYTKIHDEDLNSANAIFEEVKGCKNEALKKVRELYRLNKDEIPNLEEILKVIQEYSQAVYEATDYMQRIWGQCPDPGFLVDKMYQYLYRLYPPVFPEMLNKIDNMSEEDIMEYFSVQKEASVLHV